MGKKPKKSIGTEHNGFSLKKIMGEVYHGNKIDNNKQNITKIA